MPATVIRDTHRPVVVPDVAVMLDEEPPSGSNLLDLIIMYAIGFVTGGPVGAIAAVVLS